MPRFGASQLKLSLEIGQGHIHIVHGHARASVAKQFHHRRKAHASAEHFRSVGMPELVGDDIGGARLIPAVLERLKSYPVRSLHSGEATKRTTEVQRPIRTAPITSQFARHVRSYRFLSISSRVCSAPLSTRPSRSAPLRLSSRLLPSRLGRAFSPRSH